MAKAQESATRLADYKTASSGNASLVSAIAWLHANTAANRLSDVEISEMIRDAVAVGTFTIKFNGTTIP